MPHGVDFFFSVLASPVGQELQLLSTKLVLVQEHMVVAGAVGALNTGMAVQVEVELSGVADGPVHQSTCRRNM